MENKKNSSLLTALIIAGIGVLYILQMAPSPILTALRDHFGLESEMLINLAVNIVFLFIVIGCLSGSWLEQKLGTKNLYTLALAMVIIGSLVYFVDENNYTFLLIGRSLFGLGFGFAVPFIGSAIMKWYPHLDREKMDTVNALFPFFGTMISFVIMMPLFNFFAQRWAWSLAIWSIPVVIVMLLWIMLIKEKNLINFTLHDAIEETGKNIYLELLKRKEILLISITFICDFTCYSYIGTILPTLLFEAGSMPETQSNLVAALAFPAVGLLGSFLGGVITAKTGLRKPTLVIGQIGKFVGIMIATLGADISFLWIVIGASVFGFSNGFWMPAMYVVPMDLDKMTPAKVGAAFAMITAFGMTFGFLSPTIGGWLTTIFMNMSGIADEIARHVFGLKWSLFVFGFVNVIGTICMLMIRETGTKRV